MIVASTPTLQAFDWPGRLTICRPLWNLEESIAWVVGQMPAIFFAAALQAATPGAAIELPDYDCQAAGGYFEKHELEGSSSRVQIDGTILPKDIGRARSGWVPATGILFQPEGGKGGIGLQVWQTSRRVLAYGVRNLGQNADSPHQLGTLPTDQPIRFTIALDNSGRLEIKVNDTEHAFGGAGVQPLNPILMCSGGHFVFQQLTTLIEASHS